MLFNDWLAQGDIGVISAPDRAVLSWRRINDDPTSIILTRKNVQLDAQTVRLESNNTARMVNGTVVTSEKIYITIFGVRNHPTLADTDIDRSDRFFINNTSYEVIALATPPGEVQAFCEGTRAT